MEGDVLGRGRQGPGEEEEEPVVTLVDETGEERSFRLHDAFEVDGEAFYLVEALDEAGMVLILKEGEAGLESLTGDEFDRVLAILEAEEP